MNKKTALLIIDAQVNMFAEDCSVFGGENLLQTIRSLVSKARSAQALIVYVRSGLIPAQPDGFARRWIGATPSPGASRSSP